MQYPQKDLYGEDMDWIEFMILLSGIMPETPLGQIVSIRSEENPDTLKTYNSEQKHIRDVWRARMLEEQNSIMDDEEKEASVSELQEIFAKAFG